MHFQLVSEGDATFVEGTPATPARGAADTVTAIIEASWGTESRGALVEAASLPAEFFDLSSRVAGETLQRLRNYGLRLAVVVPPAWDGGSSRFGEMVAEERRGRDFGLFDSRDAAVRWLAG